MRSIGPVCLAITLLFTTALATEQPAGERAFTFHEIRTGVYHAVGTGAIAVGCNGAVVVNESDVLVVDSHMTPAAGRALLREIETLTDKPVRYLVNTHFHFDHVHGNQVFGPEVEIVAHEFTREKLATGGTQSGRAYDFFIKPIPDTIRQMEVRLETASDEEREPLEARIAGMERLWEAEQETTPTPPTLTLERTMVLHRGGREIRLHFLGRGHTGGDVVVYLPGEKLLVSGDLLTHGLPYMGDAYFEDWIGTLEQLKSLDVEVVLPGHGEAFEEVAKIGYLQNYLKDLWAAGTKAHGEGLSVEEAAEKIDLTSHAEHFPQIEGPGASAHAVERIYELLDGN